MPHPKSVLAYPTPYFDLLKTGLVREIPIPFPTENKARTFQLKFGAFRAALQRSPDINPELALGSYGVGIRRVANVIFIGPKRCEDEVLSALEHLKPKT